MDQLSSTVNERHNALKCTLVDSQDFKAAADDFIGWLKAVEEKLDAENPLTSELEFVQEQQREHQVGDVPQLPSDEARAGVVQGSGQGYFREQRGSFH